MPRRLPELDPSDAIWAGVAAAILGLVPFCVPLELVQFQRVDSCGAFLALAVPMYAALLLGIVLGRRARPAATRTHHVAAGNLLRVSRFMLVVTGVANLAVVVGAIAVLGLTAVGHYRKFYADLPALSLVTQYHVPFLLPFVVLAQRGGVKWKGVVAFVLFALFLRATILAERLGLAEGLVEFFVALGLLGLLRIRPRHAVVAVALTAIGWTGTEFSRNIFKQTRGVTFDPAIVRLGVQWASERFVAYYADAENKLLFAVRHGQATLVPEAFAPVPLKALNMLQLARGYQLAIDRVKTEAFQAGYVDMELTNPGGVTTLAVDWGPYGTVVALFLIGGLTGLCYRLAAAGNATALFVYGGLFIGIMDLPRFFYLGSDRYVVPMVVAAALLAFAQSVRSGWLPRPTSAPPSRV